MTRHDNHNVMPNWFVDRGARWVGLPLSSLIVHPFALASPLSIASQDEVLRSINENVGQRVDGTKLLATLLIIVAMIIVVALLNQFRKRQVEPKVVNHPGKLLKEVSRGMNLKTNEVKQLKMLAEGQDLSSPIVLLLCPSVLGRSIKAAGERIDRTSLTSLTRKLVGKRSEKD